MRLVCPNCGAQYEVDDRVIPDGGRDVQCSNCGHAWFQRHADGPHRDEAEDDPNMAPAPPVEESDPDEDWDEPAAPPREVERARRPLDENVRGILSEEADREMQARAREGGGVETQGDLGIDDYTDPEEDRRRIARERMARMRGIEEGEALDPEVAPTPPADTKRREMFPDIEEINSTLDTPEAAMAGQREGRATRTAPKERSGGFRRGFSIIIIVAAVAFAVYLLAPRIVEMFPGLTDAMVAYVDLVNRFLGWIEGLMQAAIDRIEEAAGDGQ